MYSSRYVCKCKKKEKKNFAEFCIGLIFIIFLCVLILSSNLVLVFKLCVKSLVCQPSFVVANVVT